MERRTVVASLLGGALTSLAGCGGGGGTPQGADYDVGMASSAFIPAEIEVTVGETVTWRNTNSRAHTVTAYEARIPDGADYFASGGFESETAARRGYLDSLDGSLYSGDTFEHTFEIPGEYGYFCVPHERGGMVGRVTVTE